MAKQILFIQGGGDGGYEADKALVNALQENLGTEYAINYPELQSNESEPDFGWMQQIEQQILESENGVIIVGHSLGASMLLKCLSEKKVDKKIKGIFLLATPFWSGDEDWKKGLKLQEDFAGKLPGEIPLFFYHCKDDEVVPFSDLDHFKQKLTKATFQEVDSGGHQFNQDLTLVSRDIQSIK